MKQLLSLLILVISITISAQSIKISSKLPVAKSTVNVSIPTNKVFNLDIKTPKTKEQQIGKSIQTSNTAIYKDTQYPVYATTKGKLFIVTPNKDNTGYNKKYIKP